jgi:hypothetical protein
MWDTERKQNARGFRCPLVQGNLSSGRILFSLDTGLRHPTLPMNNGLTVIACRRSTSAVIIVGNMEPYTSVCKGELVRV